MAFQKLNARSARRWAIIGFPGDGKSSFASQMVGPLLPIDVDGRFAEVTHLTDSTVLALSDNRADNNDVQAIDRHLKKNMPGSGVNTIVVDSVTPIFQRITRRHQVSEHEGNSQSANKSAVHREKADVMALLGSAVSSYGTDTLWVWHLNETQFNGAKKLNQSVSEVERDRLRKFLNAELHVVIDKNGLRGITIAWSRHGHGMGKTIWDTQENFDSGFFWKGMPEKIDAALKGTEAPPAAPAAGTTTSTPAGTTASTTEPQGPAARSFATSEDAIQWGVAELLITPEEAKTAYDEVKASAKPKSAKAMWAAWVAEVEKRKAAVLAGASGEKF